MNLMILMSKSNDMCQFGVYPPTCIYKPNMIDLDIIITEKQTCM